MKLKSKLTLLGTSLLVGLGAGLPAAHAQDQTASSEEEIVVTGSRIRRDPVNAPTPLIQLQRESIIESGEPNIIDYLADVPALQNSIVPEDTTGAGLGDGGLSLLSLRNLGTLRTLTLVDGRRHVGAGQGSPQVDIDTIPRLMIENVEVITGGASAVYGADAVAGVVNFIMRDDFEGMEFDSTYAQINQDGQSNQRYSFLVGDNAVNDRLNVYVTGEYERSGEVLDSDIDWQQASCALLNVDSDPISPASALSDGDLDNRALCGLRSYSRPYGGVLTIAHGTQPSPASDPDIPFVSCTGTSTSTNCFLIDPPYSYQFRPDGTPYFIDYGSYRDQNGTLRTTSVGGSGDPLWRFGDSRLPEAEAFRLQGGMEFDLNDSVELFTDVKWVHETSLDNFQPAFFDVQLIGNLASSPFNFYGNQQPFVFALTGFSIGLDNAYLDPALRTLIQNNVRTIYNSAGVATGTATDRRAAVRLFTDDLGSRPQDNSRDTARAVIGLRGDRDQLGFVNNFAWEIGYTWGETSDRNVESKTIDVERLAYSVDAVVDTAGLVNGTPGEIVCRVQLLAAQSITVFDQVTDTPMSPSDPRITDCTPSRLFGAGGLAPAYNYIVTSQSTENTDGQEDFLAFASGELGDPWGAGEIGIAAGYEWREESYSGQFFGNPNRILFANVLADFPEASFNVQEWFGELRVPVVRNLPFAQEIELTGSYRYSDYSTGATTDVASLSAIWRLTEDLMFRGTYGNSVRAASLGELFSPQGQTFLQLTDNCSAPVILGTADPTIRQNRIDNCAALGIPSSYVDPNPATSNAGRAGGNPDLSPEESVSWTGSIVLTPRFVPNLSVVVDYYDISIDDAIASLTLQQIMNNCVDGDAINPAACSLLTRDATTFEVIDFLQAPVNYANFVAKGVDFAVNYFADLHQWTGRNWGTLDYGIRGTYQFQRDSRLNPADSNDITELDSTVGNPHTRFNSRLTWALDRFAATWEVDWQSSQEIVSERALETDPDNRKSELDETDSFTQHDFLVRYDLNDNATLRAGVINAFDADPNVQTGAADNFDLFGRRFFVGVNLRR